MTDVMTEKQAMALTLMDGPTKDPCEGGHSIIGLSCINCDWTMKIMNLYIPSGKKVGEAFEQELRTFLPEGTTIALIDDAEVPTLNEVGFALNMHDKLYLANQMVQGLEDA